MPSGIDNPQVLITGRGEDVSVYLVSLQETFRQWSEKTYLLTYRLSIRI